MIIKMNSKFGLKVCGVQIHVKDNNHNKEILFMNIQMSQTSWEKWDFRVNKLSREGRRRGDSLWTIFKREKKRYLRPSLGFLSSMEFVLLSVFLIAIRVSVTSLDWLHVTFKQSCLSLGGHQNMLGYQTKTIQLLEYPLFEVGMVPTYFRVD